MTMTGKERAALRARANGIDTILQIGKGGIIPSLLKQVEDALNARELIKLKVLETAPLSSREAADQLAESLKAEVIQVIGAKLVLYRENLAEKEAQKAKAKARKVVRKEKEKRIKLTARTAAAKKRYGSTASKTPGRNQAPGRPAIRGKAPHKKSGGR